MPRSSSPARRSVTDVASAAESLVRVFDRAEDWAVPRISPPQAKVLGLLRYRGEMSLSALAEEMGAIPSSASRLCDRLEAAGLIAREVPSGNRRAVRLSLTNEGRRRLESFDEARHADFMPVLARMSPAAREALLEGLRAFDSAVQELREVPA